MSHQNTAWPVGHVAPQPAASSRSADAVRPSNWISYGLLFLAGSMLIALACASAWLSYHAQVGYVLAHNGHLRTEARVWALLLDTGTVGVSLLRLYETLQRRVHVTTGASLLACITASVVMNLLHNPSPSPGGYLVAAVPPVMYAVLLEHLLTSLRIALVRDEKRSNKWRTSTLWINFPGVMWNSRRSSLRREAEETATAPKAISDVTNGPHHTDPDLEEHLKQATGDGTAPQTKPSQQSFRQGRGPGPKRIAFEAALEAQVRSGDLRLFSKDQRERNAAAYQAAASLPAPLSHGAARRYVVQAVPRLSQQTGTPDHADLRCENQLMQPLY